MKLCLPKHFRKQLERVKRGGGASDVAYKQAIGAIEHWKHGLATTLPLTNHGESRLSHAKKYDLCGFHRLVTTEHAGVRTLLWIGTHDDVEHWLERHKGWDFAVANNGEITFVPTPDDARGPEDYAGEEPVTVRLSGKILSGLPDEIIDLLLLPSKALRTLRLITHEDLADDELGSWSIIDDQSFDSPDQKEAVFRVFDLLRKGETGKAKACAQLFANQAVLASTNPQAAVNAIESGAASAEMKDLSSLTEEQLRHVLSHSNYSDWLLYLHPQQQRHVDAEHNGPARLIGVSGSGKTCVLVHRANKLALRYPSERILVLVLNESLQYLIANLLNELCLPEVRSQIEVHRLYEFCYTAVKQITPKALIENYDPDSREYLSDCWRDFTEKEHAIRLIEPLVPPLQSHGVDEWAYLHDELIWIRTGFGMASTEREAYLTCDRQGRGLPFPKTKRGEKGDDKRRAGSSFPADTRLRVLAILEQYEEYMSAGGLLDEDGVALRAFEVRRLIAAAKNLRARCVLIDEVQDCSTNQLAVLSGLPTEERDGLYLVGDPVQKVFPKQQSLAAAGIDIRGRSSFITTNYRNSRQVLEAAYQIIASFRGNSPVAEDEILNPEYAFRTGPRPKLVQCKSRPEQYRCVGAMVELMRQDLETTVCVATAHPDIPKPPKPPFGAPKPAVVNIDRHVLAMCNESKWPVKSLADPVTLADLTSNVIAAKFEDMKGFEFRAVFLTDLSDKSLLANSIPKEEEWRVAFQLYVAMTRAQEELWLFSVGDPSRLLKPLLQFVDLVSPSDI
jgi:hypothetical protein